MDHHIVWGVSHEISFLITPHNYRNTSHHQSKRMNHLHWILVFRMSFGAWILCILFFHMLYKFLLGELYVLSFLIIPCVG